jgi:hypothetical protein
MYYAFHDIKHIVQPYLDDHVLCFFEIEDLFKLISIPITLQNKSNIVFK